MLYDTQMTDYWVLKYPDGGLVGLDDASGGYPYHASNPAGVRWWIRREDAEKYMKVCAKDNFTLHKVLGFHTGRGTVMGGDAKELVARRERRTVVKANEKYSCDYCCDVGACPKCWGRGAIEELKKEIESLKNKVK